MAKEKLNVNSSNKKVKQSLKKLAFGGLLATTLLTGCGDGKKVGNGLDEKKSNPIEVVEKNKYEGKSIDGVEGMIISENPNTKQLFLSDGKEKLTSDFDNIKNVVKVGEDLYFLGGNGGKYSLYKNGEAILSDFDDIDYRIINGELVTIAEIAGKKTVKRGEKFIGESCNEAIFKDITDDSNQGRCIYIEKGGKAKIFIDGKQYGPEISSLDIKNNPRCLQVSKCGDDYMIICDCRMNTHDRPNNTIIYKGKIMYIGLDRAIPNDVRKLKCYDKFGLGDRNVIVVKKGNGKEELYDTKLGKIGTEYDSIDLYSGGEDNCDWIDGEYVATKDHLLLYAQKNGKTILIVDGEDYEVSNYTGKYFSLDGNSLDGILFLKKGEKSYYIGNDWTLHEFEGTYDDVLYAGKTSDGIVYFIGKKGNKECFVFNGEVQGKGYDYISGAGLVEGKHVYVRGERDGEKIFVLNGTERGVDSTTNNSQERKSDLFTR